MEYQICPKCGKSKPTSQFGRNAYSSTGLKRVCKQCEAKASRERRQKLALERQCVIDEYNRIIKEDDDAIIPTMSDISDSDIIAELRKRGYSGELQYSTSVTL